MSRVLSVEWAGRCVFNETQKELDEYNKLKLSLGKSVAVWK